MGEEDIEVKQSLKMQVIMFACYLVLAIPAIIYIDLLILRLFLPGWTILYLYTIFEIIKKNDIQRLAVREGSLYIKRFSKFKFVETQYRIGAIQVTHGSRTELSNGGALNEFEIKYFGKVVGRFNDSRYYWNLKKLHTIMGRIEGKTTEEVSSSLK